MPPKVKNANNIFMELRKICQHPYLSAPELDDENLAEEERHRLLTQSSGKLAFLKILLPKLKERGHRVLLFSQFKIALNEIQAFLVGEGYKFLRIDGDVQQASRQKSIDAYNAPDSDYFIFLLTTRAGGVGINLATADTVIVYDPDFNPHQDLQAIARSHRYGQNKKVLVFKLMTKDSIEEQIVYNGKKKMVLDHLVVQNLGKENDDEDVSSMLLAGAKALYDTNADGVSASDVTYTSKQVEEMIDKVEQQADEEAVLLQEKWTKEDSMTEEEKLAALSSKGVETMDFSFAKIWETDKGELQEVDDDPALENVMEDAMEDTFAMIWENAERAKKEQAAQAALDRKERRKKIDYTFDDTTPKKKPLGRPKGAKNKEKVTELSGSRVQSSGSEFDFNDDEISDTETIDMQTIAEDMGMLDEMDAAGSHHGQLRRKGKEISGMERQAMRRQLEAEMAHHTAPNDPSGSNAVAGPSTWTEPMRVTSGVLSQVRNGSSSRHPGETPEQRVIRRKAKREAKIIRARERQALEQQLRNARADNNGGTSTLQQIPSIPGPSGWTGSSAPRNVYAYPSNAVALAAKSATTNQTDSSSIPRDRSPVRKPPSIIQMARSSSDATEISKAQDIIKWLWHALQEMGMQKEIRAWGRMVLSEVPAAERKGIYWELAREADKQLVEAGHARYFNEPQHRSALEVLFNNGAPGLPEDPGRVMPPPPKGVGRLVNKHSNGETSTGNGHLSMSAMSTSIPLPTGRDDSATMSASSSRNDSELRPAQALLLKTPQQIAAQARIARDKESGIGVGVRPVSVIPRPVVSDPAPRIAPPTQNANGSGSVAPKTATSTTAQAAAGPSNSTSLPANPNGPASVQRVSDAQRLHKALLPGPLPSVANAYHGIIIEAPVGLESMTPVQRSNFCILCLQDGHLAPRCPPEVTPPEKELQRLMGHRRLELQRPGLDADRKFMAFREFNEMVRRSAVRDRINAAIAARPPDPVSQPLPRAYVPPPVAPAPQPTFGIPMPKRRKTTQDGPSTSQRSPAAPGSGINSASGPSGSQRIGRNGATRSDAIAVDDEDDRVNAVAISTAPTASALRATPSASFGATPDCETCSMRNHLPDKCPLLRATPTQIASILASIPPDHPKRAAIQKVHDKKAADSLCLMCAKACGLGVRECAESLGGRKALKDRIRVLNAQRVVDGDEAEPSPVMVRLFDCYQAWPRGDTPKKKLKVEI